MNPISAIARALFDAQETLYQRRVSLKHPGKLSDLNMPIGNTAVYSTDTGSLVSVFKLEGSREYVLADNHQEHVNALYNTLRAIIARGTTDICFLHNHNDEPELNKRLVEQAIKPSRNVSRIQGLSNEAFHREMIDVMAACVQSEDTYLCVWTLKKEGLTQKSTIPNLSSIDTQGTMGFWWAERLMNSHQATVGTIENGLKDIGFYVELLTNQEVGEMIAKNVDPDANKNFVPRLFGQINEGNAIVGEREKLFFLRTPTNIRAGVKGKEYSCVFPPKLGYQVWSRRPVYESDYVTIGSRSYASIMVSLSPDSPVAFEKLVGELKRGEVPFRIAMHSKSDSKGAVMAKYVLASMLRRLPGNNSLIQGSISQMRKFIKRQGAALSLQIVLTTWASSRDIPLLRRRIEQVLNALGVWGASQGRLMSDDSLFGLISTLPPYRSKSVAPAAVGPADEVLYLAPITRPTLPWSHGGVLFRSHTGKLMPFPPMSDLMAHHVYLVCGEPGFGKSLLCQIILISLAESYEVLPFIAITDVGSSSLGTIRYLQNVLPQYKKHQVFYREMANSRRLAINITDTPLGLRHPLRDDFEYKRDWLLLGVSDSQTGSNKEGMDTLITDALKLAYDRCADAGPKSEPKRHEESNEQDPFWAAVIGPALERIGIKPGPDDTYWELVDALFDAGEYRAATLMQRFATPLLSDIARAVNAEEIRKAHRQEISPGFTLADFAYQRVNSLQAELEVTQVPTQIDLSDARIIAFNLESVVSNSTSIAAKRVGALYFGLTSSLQVEKFFWNDNRVNEIPSRYRQYHAKATLDVKRTNNLYFADEQQFFTGIEVANQIPENIASMGRKRGAGVMLSTQLPRNFSDNMIDLSTARFYVGFSRTSIPGVKKHMRLTDWEAWVLENKIHKPNRNGASMLVQFDTEKGSYSQFVNLRVGPRKLWGLSTKRISSIVRDDVTAEFGYEVGLDILRRLYPSGEVESEYERRRLQLEEQGIDKSGLEQIKERLVIDDIVQHITNEIIRRGKEYFVESLSEVNHE